MFTKEQLAKWREMGFQFDSFYDEVAVEKPAEASNNLDIEKETEDNIKFLESLPTTINEDAEDRYIRKVLHMIRNFRAKRRTVNILMITNTYKALNIDINGHIVKRVALYTKPQNQQYINLDNIKDENLRINIDEKLYLIFSDINDKKAVLKYISSTNGPDNFIPAFSKFNLKTIQAEIKSRQGQPHKIRQRSTPLCGIVCIGFLMIKYQFDNYKNLIEDLFYYAEAFYSNHKYLIKPRNSYFDQVYDIGPKDPLYPNNDQCDYIFLCSIKSSENKIRSYDGKNDGGIIDGLGGLTLPGEMLTLLEKLLRGTLIEDFTKFTHEGYDEIEYLNRMHLDYLNKYECLMFINSAMLDTSHVYSIPDHWVTYCGELKETFMQNEKYYTFKVATWGKIQTVTISENRFKVTSYGYIKCKIN